MTTTRILLLPFFAAALIYGYNGYALILFIFAAVTDVLDGLLARLQNQTTTLGSILDPVADKFLLITSFILMTLNGWIPKWLTITVISRDLIIVTGWLIFYFVTHTVKVEPSMWGKTANVLQSVMIGITLLLVNIKGSADTPMPLLIAVASFTAVSGILYIYRGLKTINA
ncbi:MAG: CDP-alcohol phosphatidyltransferase family protein [Nitrospirae bacterium]|nr:CDP-alcohol phosphatidyltransferase family protein [Nitrospirota bacterium]